jgi:hypothetical protein
MKLDSKDMNMIGIQILKGFSRRMKILMISATMKIIDIINKNKGKEGLMGDKFLFMMIIIKIKMIFIIMI